ncbi:metal ABC transporter solute-binding protein, Zn/Mn family [Amycolatopsis taiwanensis]|uniref:Metal ABC transporter substrate-binding protein n=1 Tax=Amycolatopsis taiwanensis TaxID=342230 RepID=A0A9W6R3E8_9PSEU|nr:zinc ABC transporter substrate-binding protein [Amycolatopsis taiwanensis]GLY68538.1 metal ABC transporter substrate-binding protein [Amycolatopsis taiwanensis]
MSFRKPSTLVLACVTVLSLALTACGGANTSGAPGTGKIGVVTSTDVWGSVVSAVGGDQVSVTSIIHDPSADPHSYETTPGDVVATGQAELTLGNGGGYDDFFTKLTEQAPNARKLVAVDIAGTGEDNEHVWYSFTGVNKVADQVAAQLGQLRPEAAQTFTANANAFKEKVDALGTKAAGIGANHPDAKVLMTEPVPQYLVETAKLTDATPEAFSHAIENETDVPPATLAEVNQLISGKQIQVVLNNEQTVTPTTTQVVNEARQAGLPVVGVTETLPAGAADYLSWMTGQVDALAGAVG